MTLNSPGGVVADIIASAAGPFFASTTLIEVFKSYQLACFWVEFP